MTKPCHLTVSVTLHNLYHMDYMHSNISNFRVSHLLNIVTKNIHVCLEIVCEIDCIITVSITFNCVSHMTMCEGHMTMCAGHMTICEGHMTMCESHMTMYTVTLSCTLLTMHV